MQDRSTGIGALKCPSCSSGVQNSKLGIQLVTPMPAAAIVEEERCHICMVGAGRLRARMPVLRSCIFFDVHVILLFILFPPAFHFIWSRFSHRFSQFGFLFFAILKSKFV